MRKIAIFAAAAAALISTVGIAGEQPKQSFTRDGHTYVYTTTTREDGRMLIEGRETGSNGRFRLVVSGDRVTGSSNGYPVSFRTSTPLATMVASN